METAGKSPECVEHELGEVLAARSAAIANSENVPGVGPPDLCWIQRTAKGIFSKKKPKMQGYYHWVVGLPVSSSASVAAYFARLTSAVKKVGYYQGMGVGREFTIGRGIYCCYNPFADMDIWVEIAVPGGAVSRGLDRHGYLHDVTTEMWRGAHVGCFLRSALYDASVTLHCSRAFQHMAFFRGQDDETELLQSVKKLYASGTAQEVQKRIQWDQGQGTEPYHMDIICTSLLDHFKKRRRWQQALRFFTELEDDFPSSVVYQAEVYRELDNSVGAAKLLKSALLNMKKEDHPMLVLACGYIYLEDSQYSKAIRIAESVLDIDPQVRPGWLLLSRALLHEGQAEKCLRALHLMPSPLIPSDRKTLLLRVLPPQPKFITRQQGGYDPETAELNMESQETRKVGVLMHTLPGEILAPRCQLHGADWGFISCTQCVMRAAYDILLNTVHSVGWERFCEIRASVFILPSEEEGIGSEKAEWWPVKVSLVVDEDASLTTNRPVALSLELRESAPWERPRRKTSLVVRSMSVGAPNPALDANSSVAADASQASQVATNVLSRGLGAVTKKAIRRPSTESTVLRDDAEQTLSPTSETLSDGYSVSPRAERQNKTMADSEPEPDASLSPHPKTSCMHTPLSKGEDTPKRQRKIVEVVTTAELLPEEDEVPDAPENALPKQCPPYGMDSGRHGPPSSTSFSQDRWQVKIVSMGIKDRVKYFDQMAKEKMAKQSISGSDSHFENEPYVINMRPRRSRYSIAQTIMERLIHDIPSPESIAEAPVISDEGGSGDADEGELESSESVETLPPMADWGSFALDEASCVPQSTDNRRHSRVSLFDGNSSGTFLDVTSNGPHRDIDEDFPCECTEWLDELTLALWEDLAVYTDFKTLDRKLKSKNRQTHAEQILGTIEWNTDTTDDDDFMRTPTAGPALPDSRPVDWMRRGMLCERLGKTADAEQSYRACVFQNFNLTSLLALARIYSEWGYCKGAILLLTRLAQFHHKKYNSQKNMYLVESLVKNISLLLTSVGNKDVRSACEDSHPLLTHALDNVLKWNMQSVSPRMNNPSD